MSINRDELKSMIDHLSEEDTVEVMDFIGYLNLKRKREELDQMDINKLSGDRKLIKQVMDSRSDREEGRIYEKDNGLEYLRRKNEEFENGQNL